MPARLKVLTAEQLATADTRALVKHYLAVLETRAPGRSVEVRVPPFAAVQAVPGVRHTRGTPPAVVARLNQEIRAVLSSDDARASFATQGMQPAFSTPEEFGRLIERDQARWARVVARAKISAD